MHVGLPAVIAMTINNGILASLLLALLTGSALAQSIDDGFNPAAYNGVVSLVVQPDGKLLAGGNFINIGGLARPLLAKINPDGSIDAGFNANLSGVSVRGEHADHNSARSQAPSL